MDTTIHGVLEYIHLGHHNQWCPITVPKSKFLYQVIILCKNIFQKYSDVPFISKGAKIGAVWKTKSYLEELTYEYKKNLKIWNSPPSSQNSLHFELCITDTPPSFGLFSQGYCRYLAPFLTLLVSQSVSQLVRFNSLCLNEQAYNCLIYFYKRDCFDIMTCDVMT